MKSLLQKFKDLKFKKKLFLTYLLVSTLPILVLGAYSFNESKASLMNQTIQGLSDSTAKMSRNISYKTERYNDIMNFIVYNSKIQQIFSNNYLDMVILAQDLRDYLDPFFSNIMNINKDIKQLTVYSTANMPEYGKYINDFSKVEELPWAKETIKSDGIRWFFDDGTLFAACRLADTSSGRLLGIVYIELYYGRILGDAADINLSQYGILIVDAKRNTLLSTNHFSKEIKPLPKWRLLKAKQDILQYNGESYITIASEIPKQHWTIFSYTPVKSVIASSRKIIYSALIISGICFIVLLFLIMLFANTMVKRINRLNNDISIVEKGNFQIEVHSNSKDEIGQLTNQFGRMVKTIGNLIEEVYERKLIQRDAEIKALQAQINPHFLYNTLSAINWKAVRLEADEISSMVTSLSKFYRTALNKGKIITSMRNELENTKSYIEIQRVIYDYSFDIIYNIDDDVYEYDTLNLLLQPIVENAIEHGIIKKRIGRGVIILEAVIKEDTIEFMIKDNGIGMDEKQMTDVLNKESSGYGLKNVNDRIKLFFGDMYGLTINSIKGAGSEVFVRLPQYKGYECRQ